jgi:3',5'-cyclic AMP phosphodiesterase CpdA
MAIKSMFLILSDLHFGRDLHLGPELPPLRITRAARWLGRDDEIERFIARNCGGHDFACVSMLARQLKLIVHEAGIDEHFERDNFDFCLLLGDQATAPDPQAYKFLRQYLTGARYTSVGIDCAGLGFRPDQLLAIPGNHDKLFRTNLDIYQQEFVRRLELPEVESGRSMVVIRRFGETEIVFLMIDPSIYATEELTIDRNCRSHLASGAVTPGLAREVVNKMTNLRDKGEVDGQRLQGEFASALKILLVHYAVDLSRLPRSRQWSETFLPHGCQGLDNLVAALRTGFQFQLAIHGHMHVAWLYNYGGVQIVSSSTASGKGGNNGFFVLKFFDNNEIRAEHYCWTGNRFTPDPEPPLTKQLGTLTKGKVA